MAPSVGSDRPRCSRRDIGRDAIKRETVHTRKDRGHRRHLVHQRTLLLHLPNPLRKRWSPLSVPSKVRTCAWVSDGGLVCITIVSTPTVLMTPHVEPSRKMRARVTSASFAHKSWSGTTSGLMRPNSLHADPLANTRSAGALDEIDVCASFDNFTASVQYSSASLDQGAMAACMFGRLVKLSQQQRGVCMLLQFLLRQAHDGEQCGAHNKAPGRCLLFERQYPSLHVLPCVPPPRLPTS